MQTALAGIMALTFPGMKTVIGTRDVSGFAGVFHETNRYAVLTPIATIFVTALANWVYVGPETYRVMKERKHQGLFFMPLPVYVMIWAVQLTLSRNARWQKEL